MLLWEEIQQEDGSLRFKLEGQVFLRKRDEPKYRAYEENIEDFSKKNISPNQSVHLNLLIYRMGDLVTKKLTWTVSQIGVLIK